MKKTKIIFFGTSKIAAENLKKFILSEYLEVSLVVSKHAKTPVALFAADRGIEVFTPEKFEANANQKLASLEPEIFAIVDFGKLLPLELLNIPKKGSFNLHFSLLPSYRGASPVQSAILNGEKISGVSIFRLTQKLDDGDILVQEKVNISEMRADKVFEKMLEIGASLFCDVLEKIARNIIVPEIKQDHSKATFCQKFTKKDGLIIPNKEQVEIFLRKVRAFYPWPSAYFEDEKLGLIKILDTKKIENDCVPENRKGLFVDDKRLFLMLKDGCVEILQIQREGKKVMSGEEFARGMKS